jgi:ABC-type nitrate/sulfonate/bicarbonate transport system substrate-binding protein
VERLCGYDGAVDASAARTEKKVEDRTIRAAASVTTDLCPLMIAELMQRFEKTGLTEQEDIHASQKRLFTKNHKFKHQD